ncbi:MAG: CRTAC1 family protein [Bryobacteraceae bacterium]
MLVLDRDFVRLVVFWCFALGTAKPDGPTLPVNQAQLPTFADVTPVSGVGFRQQSCHTPRKYLIETMGAGVAMLDYDGDGRQDIFFVNGAALKDPMPGGERPDKSESRYWNRLYRNNGNGTFTDVTVAAGVQGHSYGQGVAVADYDNDGRPDLYVTNFGRNILYHNNGNGTFSDVTEKSGTAGGGWSTGALFVDYDRDGFLDLIVSRYMEWDFSMDIWCGEHRPGYRSFCHPNDFKPATALVYHNNGDGTFTDVTAKAGFAGSPGKGLGCAFNDFDHDGWPDVLIANDNAPQQLFHNNRNGTFSEAGVTAGLAYDDDGHALSGMGADFEDYDNDGWPDVFIDALANEKYGLFHNLHGTFQYHSGPANIAATTRLHSGWGAKFIDYDNDGWKDLFVAQSHVMDNIDLMQPPLHYLETLFLLHNNRGKFEDVSARSGPPFQARLAARGAAFGDLDNDGFVDTVVSVNDGNPVILRNLGNKNHWLLIDTEGVTSNRDGIGAQLHVVSESGVEQYAVVTTGGSYLSASDKRVHFGLGADKHAKLLEVTWPSGVVQKLTNVPADQIVAIREPGTPKHEVPK